MRKLIILTLGFAFFWSSISSQAEIQRYLSGSDVVVYDDVAGLAWMADMSDASTVHSMNYDVQLGVIANMNATEFHGLKGWHMATETEMDHLVQNPLSRIESEFITHVFGNTSVASGRYENFINPQAANKHDVFTLNRVDCCEPYSTGWTFEETIPQPGNDIFFFAGPDPITGVPTSSMPDTNAFGFGAWVVTSQAYVNDDQLAPLKCYTTSFGGTICNDPVATVVIGLTIIGFIILGAYIWRRRRP